MEKAAGEAQNRLQYRPESICRMAARALLPLSLARTVSRPEAGQSEAKKR